MASVTNIKDIALEAVRNLLERFICECGCTDGCHVPTGPGQLGECAECDNCKVFRPVRFHVERVK
jgi:hypothetical protein